MTTDYEEIDAETLERYLIEEQAWHERKHGLELTPSQVVDLHIEFAAWLRTKDAEIVFESFKRSFVPNNEPYDWQMPNNIGPELVQQRRRVDEADTFYVSHEMMMLAAEAAEDLEGMPIFERDLESRNMFIVLPATAHDGYFYRDVTGGLQGYDQNGKLVAEFDDSAPDIWVPIRVIHLTHGPKSIRLVEDGKPVEGSDGLVDGLQIMLYSENQLVWETWIEHREVFGKDGVSAGYLEPTPGERHRLAPIEFTAWSYGTPWQTDEHQTNGMPLNTAVVARSVGENRRFLLSLLLLMKEEIYTEREKPDRPARRRMQASSLNVPDDYCVSVTRLRRPHQSASKYDPEGESRYSHRWTVRGHWRRYHKGTPDERAVWITPYVKGPEGAPFIQKRKLTALVR